MLENDTKFGLIGMPGGSYESIKLKGHMKRPPKLPCNKFFM